MAPSYAVVDGSNIATEGRSVPSLVQLDDAVRQFQGEFPGIEVIVVVDATFGHRIDPSERKAFDEAVAHAELVSPPAGAVGRGDAFLLRVAERVGAQVLSNDSFQEFHAEHPWLFDEGRLIGGKPVPGVGWIFTPRSPVRGVRSRAVMAVGSGRVAKATKATKVAKGTDRPQIGDTRPRGRSHHRCRGGCGRRGRERGEPGAGRREEIAPGRQDREGRQSRQIDQGRQSRQGGQIRQGRQGRKI